MEFAGKSWQFESVLRVLIFWPIPKTKRVHDDMTNFIWFGKAAVGTHSASFRVAYASGENCCIHCFQNLVY